MKTKLFYTFILLSVFTVKAQNVNIPDANFKAYLLANFQINLNKDNEISLAEATNTTAIISVRDKAITNLKGIEAFVNITSLRCDKNFITSLDLSKNTKLTNLIAKDNQLNTIVNSLYKMLLFCT